MGFIAATPETAGEIATLLLAMADEQGLDQWAVQSIRVGTRYGFMVPDSVSDILNPPPPGWRDPLPEVNVTLGEDGKYYAPAEVVNAAGREEIRAWALENGYQPAPVGKLKQSVIEAFRLAHPDRATAE